MAKTSPDNDTIRKIWLAGIGAYGRAFAEAKGAVDSLTGKGSEVFDELVQKGEVLEAVGKYKALTWMTALQKCVPACPAQPKNAMIVWRRVWINWKPSSTRF